MSEHTDGPDDLAQEASRGRSARTPALAFGGVIGAIAVVVAIFLAIAFAIYFLV